MRSLNCRPPHGKTYLTIGQDLFSIAEYVDSQYNVSLHHNSTKPRSSFFPAVAMVYTDIQTLRGLDTPVDYGSGVEFANGLLDSVLSQEIGLQIGLWLNGTAGCHDLVQGKLDEQVHALLKYLEECDASRVFLRVGYEFDNPSFGYMQDPLVYRQAFRMLKEECLYQSWDCPNKVKFVWHSWAASSSGQDLDKFYPGNDVVDWIGISIFQQLNNDTQMEFVDTVLHYAKKRHKPCMIAESTPFGGITTWEDWFAPLLQLIESYDIEMWSYINCNWEEQPMWHNIGFGDTLLSTNTTVMEQWHDLIVKSDRFLGAGSLKHYCTAPAASIKKHSLPHNKRQHPKQASSSPRRPRFRNKHEALILAAFFMFWVIVALWVWWHRRASSQDRHHEQREAGRGGERSYEYGAVEARR
jgi:hypothetical protein